MIGFICFSISRSKYYENSWVFFVEKILIYFIFIIISLNLKMVSDFDYYPLIYEVMNRDYENLHENSRSKSA